VFLPAIRRLFYLRADYERTRAQLEITELMVQGSMGQWRTNPLADQLLKLEAAIGRLETEFGLTLSAAARLAVDVGGAKRSFEEANRRIEQQHPKPDPRLAGKRPPPRRRAPAESRG
jgi:hypothetical protein